MSNIKFVSHEKFPEDQYTLELIYLLIDDKYRVAYVRKQTKTGGKFWAVPSVAITKNGAKTYYECFLQDSTFLEKDIHQYLDSREWEKERVSPPPKPSYSDTEIPF